MRTALIDADICAYRAAAFAEANGDDEETACKAAIWTVGDWTERSGCSRTICCLSHEVPSFRYSLLPSYKAGRKNKPQPIYRKACIEAIKSRFTCYSHPRLEGDDMLGIVATSGKLDCVIVSIDKDLGQIPGKHFNPVKNTETESDAYHADEVWLYQWVCGDSSDGYTGIPGYGPAKARTLVEADNPIRAIFETFIAKGLTIEDAITQALVSRIVRSEDWLKCEKTVSFGGAYRTLLKSDMWGDHADFLGSRPLISTLGCEVAGQNSTDSR